MTSRNNRIPGHYRVVYVVEHVADGMISVRGATYHVRKELRALGFRWNPEAKEWIGRLAIVDPERVNELLRSYGCIYAGRNGSREALEFWEVRDKWLCPWR